MTSQDSIGHVWLSMDDPTSKVRQFRAYSSAEQDVVKQSVLSVINKWQTDWGVGKCADNGAPVQGNDSVSVVDYLQVNQLQSWRTNWSAANYSQTEEVSCTPLFWRILSDARGDDVVDQKKILNNFGHYFWGTDAEKSTLNGAGAVTVAQEVAIDAWQDLLRRFINVYAPQTLNRVHQTNDTVSSRPQKLEKPSAFSEYLLVKFLFFSITVYIAYSSLQVASILGSGTFANEVDANSLIKNEVKPNILEHVLSHHQLSLQAYLKDASVTLGQLETLCVGDVLTLDHGLDGAINIVSDQQEVIAHAWLGQSQGLIAVELISNNI